MTSTLNEVNHKDLLYLLGTFCAGKAGFSIDTATNDVETDNAFDYCIGGIWYTNAIDAAIDISAEISSLPAALASGYECVYMFEIDASGNYTVSAGDPVLVSDITAGTKTADWPQPSSTSVCPFGAVRVRNETGSAFTLGTTGLDTSGITDTFYDICRGPVHF